jgi:hypothetical protein
VQFRSEMLAACWDCDEAVEGIMLRTEIEAQLQPILARYVAVPQGWCPVQK